MLANQQLNHPLIQEAQKLYLFPSKRTCQRHERRRLELGHFRHFRRTGNKRATVLRGVDNFMLSYWRSVWPKSTIAELNALLFVSQISRGVQNPRFFSPSQISKAEDRLGLSNKRGSTTVYQAILPRNLAKRWVYWNMNYPAGIADIPKQDWIDIDEAGIFVETSNRKSGKQYIGVRVREEGPYNHTQKYTLTMAIEGDPSGDRWFDLEQKSGTTIADFYSFVERILDSIGDGTPERRRLFTMDNLLAHRHTTILQLIVSRNHRVCFRAPYWPVDGAIEYVFNTIQHDLTIKLSEIKNATDLRREVNSTIGAIPDFVDYFDNLSL